MTKLSKRIRKGAGRLLRQRFAQEVLEDLISAALIAAAAKIADSRTGRDAARAVKDAAKSVERTAKREAPAKKKRARRR